MENNEQLKTRIEQLEALLAKRTKEYNQLLEIKNNYQRQLSIQEPLLEVYRLNSTFENVYTNIDLSLTHVAGTLNADAAVIVKRSNNNRIISSSYQYYYQTDEKKGKDLQTFCKNFNLSDSFSLIIKEFDELPTTPYLKIDSASKFDSVCRQCGIDSIALTPIRTDGKVTHYLLALNPNVGVDRLMTMNYFSPAYADSLKRIQEQKRIERMAITDNFTGLYDKGYLNQYVNELETNPPETISLIIIDLFRLKFINDTYGHEIGDQFIKTVGAYIDRTFNVGTNKAFRYGGDEFVIICPDMNKEYCQMKMNDLDELMNQTVLHDKHGIPIQIRFDAGYAFGVRDSFSFKDLLTEADEKMNESKNAYYIEHGMERRK